MLALTAKAQRLRQLQAKAEALGALGLASEADAVRAEIHAIEEDRHTLLGLCDALRVAGGKHPVEVEAVYRQLDPTGALLALLRPTR